MAKKERLSLEIGGHEVSVSSPRRVVFPEAGHTKLDLVRYYEAVAEGALRGAGGRPNVLKRFMKGVSAEPFFQKRAPKSRPDWLRTVSLGYASGRSAEEVVPEHPAALAWMVNLGCVDLNPHAIRADDLTHPDELRIDLDPVRGVEWPQIRDVAEVVREALDARGLVGWPKTSGSRGIHVNVRIAPRWTFDEVRLAAQAFARDVERRAPEIATAKWWKEERHGVFLDFNQNAYDRTVASAYSVRPTPDARVSAPITWDELPDCDPRDFTLATVPARYAGRGDPHEGIDDAVGDIDGLLELAAKQKADGADDAPREEHPLLVVAKAQRKADALAGLERWKARHPEAAAHLEPADVLVDAMRGRFKTWTRVRVNLRHVPEPQRPPQEAPDPDYDPSVEWRR